MSGLEIKKNQEAFLKIRKHLQSTHPHTFLYILFKFIYLFIFESVFHLMWSKRCCVKGLYPIHSLSAFPSRGLLRGYCDACKAWDAKVLRAQSHFSLQVLQGPRFEPHPASQHRGFWGYSHSSSSQPDHKRTAESSRTRAPTGEADLGRQRGWPPHLCLLSSQLPAAHPPVWKDELASFYPK